MYECKMIEQNVLSTIQNIGGSIPGIYTGYAAMCHAAGTQFVNELNAAIANMSGDYKNALSQYINHVVAGYVLNDLPNAINSLSVLLETNRAAFVEADRNLSNSIQEFLQD